MLKFYTSVILLINQSKEIGKKQISVFRSRRGQNIPLMHVHFGRDWVKTKKECAQV